MGRGRPQLNGQFSSLPPARPLGLPRAPKCSYNASSLPAGKRAQPFLLQACGIVDLSARPMVIPPGSRVLEISKPHSLGTELFHWGSM